MERERNGKNEIFVVLTSIINHHPFTIMLAWVVSFGEEFSVSANIEEQTVLDSELFLDIEQLIWPCPGR